MAKRLRISYEEVHHLETVERTLAEVMAMLDAGCKNTASLRRKLEVYAVNPMEAAMDGITGRNGG